MLILVSDKAKMFKLKASHIVLLSILFFLLIASKSYSQEKIDSSNTTIYVDNSDNTIVEQIGEIYVKFLNGNVRVIHDSTFFYCDSAILKDNDLSAIGNVVILQPDSTTLFSDSLTYNSDSLKAILTGKVLLTHKGKELRTKEMEYDVGEKMAYYNNGGQVKQDSTILTSKKGIYKIRENRIFFKEYVSILDSSFSLRADSLYYHTASKTAFFTGPTMIDQDSSRIYCESGFYDINNRVAEFSEDAVYLENDKTATANRIRYEDENSLFILGGNAHYKDDDQDVKADTIKYFKEQETSILIGNVDVKAKNNSVTGSYVVYDHDSGDFTSRGRSSLSEDEFILTADHIDFSEEEGNGSAYGNIILQDTTSKTSIHCDQLITKNNNSHFIAYNDSLSRPLMKKAMDSDTLYLAADTLYSYEVVEAGDTFQMLNAFYNVKIFQESFQAIADSLSYNSMDSVFVLFKSPVMWSDTTQFSGDTISIFMANDQIEQLYLRPNAIIINAVAGKLYNQIAGKTVKAFFKSDSLDYMNASGNAESIYYMEDDLEALVGVIKTVCSKMDFYFEDNDIRDIRYYQDPISKMGNIKKELNNPQRLKAFKWLIDQKPWSKDVHIITFSPDKNGEIIIDTLIQNEQGDRSEQGDGGDETERIEIPLEEPDKDVINNKEAIKEEITGEKEVKEEKTKEENDKKDL